MKYNCSMETVQQNGRFTLFSSKFPSFGLNLRSCNESEFYNLYPRKYCYECIYLLCGPGSKRIIDKLSSKIEGSRRANFKSIIHPPPPSSGSGEGKTLKRLIVLRLKNILRKWKIERSKFSKLMMRKVMFLQRRLKLIWKQLFF